MNAITTPAQQSPAVNEDELIHVLERSLYPGAKSDSIRLVLAYCKFHGLDPMLKCVHIVPQRIRVSRNPDRWESRDVLMPGIADYRVKAARSGEYGGKGEPEFGPVKGEKFDRKTVRYPEWCKVTVRRLVGGGVREFTAKEYWLENYAAAGHDTNDPNAMWEKRPYGQLAKCAESQALRMAFPEFSGGIPTVEEMEGKEAFGGTTIEAESTLSPAPPTPPPDPPKMTWAQWIDSTEIALKDAKTSDEIHKVLDSPRVLELRQHAKGAAKERLEALVAEHGARAARMMDAAEGEVSDEIPWTDLPKGQSEDDEPPAIRGEEKVFSG